MANFQDYARICSVSNTSDRIQGLKAVLVCIKRMACSVASSLSFTVLLGAAGITTGLDTTEEEGRDRPMQKAKMEIILIKSPKFDDLMAASSSQQQSSSSSPGASSSNPLGGLPGTGPSSQLQVGTAPHPSHKATLVTATCGFATGSLLSEHQRIAQEMKLLVCRRAEDRPRSRAYSTCHYSRHMCPLFSNLPASHDGLLRAAGDHCHGSRAAAAPALRPSHSLWSADSCAAASDRLGAVSVQCVDCVTSN